jgi:hypothetical protein
VISVHSPLLRLADGLQVLSGACFQGGEVRLLVDLGELLDAVGIVAALSAGEEPDVTGVAE